jgi:hypothetical protein
MNKYNFQYYKNIEAINYLAITTPLNYNIDKLKVVIELNRKIALQKRIDITEKCIFNVLAKCFF